MRKTVMGLIAAVCLTGPAFAQPEAAIVMRYRLPDGSVKPLLFTAPEGFSLADCRSEIRDVLPMFKQQVSNRQAFPEFAGAEFMEASCERYSEDLIR